jgi:hypothetical protein
MLIAMTEKFTKSESNEISLISQLTKLRTLKSQTEVQIESLSTSLEELSVVSKKEIEELQHSQELELNKLNQELKEIKDKEKSFVIVELKYNSQIDSLRQANESLAERLSKLEEKLNQEIVAKLQSLSIASDCRQMKVNLLLFQFSC